MGGAIRQRHGQNHYGHHRDRADSRRRNGGAAQPLLADTDHQVAEKYAAWREKNMYGKKSMGIQRSTYVIDAAGKIVKVYKRVQVDGHDQQVLDILAGLESAS